MHELSALMRGCLRAGYTAIGIRQRRVVDMICKLAFGMAYELWKLLEI
jgi:hypothetical protein